MAINLNKGERVNLQKQFPTLKVARVGLSWDANKFSTGGAYDLDVTAFVCKNNAEGKPILIGDGYMVYYNNLSTPNKEVIHKGDNRTGEASGDDETIVCDVSKIVGIADEIAFIVTIYDAVGRKQNFGQISNSKIKIYNDETGELLVQYDLENDFSGETAVQFGSLVKNNGEMTFKAVGQGFKAGLADFVTFYGASVA